jgi:hypothetical protein
VAKTERLTGAKMRRNISFVNRRLNRIGQFDQEDRDSATDPPPVRRRSP